MTEQSTAGSGDHASRAERLQKVLAEAGLGSRRACEDYIVTGRVTIDGRTVTELGTKVDPWAQKVCVDGERIKLERRQYYLLNKPPGVLCTTSDPAGRPRAVDLVPRTSERLFTVGRLDESTEGLLLITNDGDLAHRMAHPRFQVQRVYRAMVAGIPAPETLEELMRGVYLAEGKFRIRDIRRISTHGSSALMELVLTEGHNREIRRLLARAGHKVMRLRRVAFGPLKLAALETGEWRPLSSPEISELHRFAAGVDEAAGPRRSRRKSAPRPARTAPPEANEARPRRVLMLGQTKPAAESAEPVRARRSRSTDAEQPQTPRPRTERLGTSRAKPSRGKPERAKEVGNGRRVARALGGTDRAEALSPDAVAPRISVPREGGPRVSGPRTSGPRTSAPRAGAPRTGAPRGKKVTAEGGVSTGGASTGKRVKRTGKRVAGTSQSGSGSKRPPRSGDRRPGSRDAK